MTALPNQSMKEQSTATATPNGSDHPPVRYEDPGTIVPSPFNKDRGDEKDPAFQELLESIRQHGIIQPLIVRPSAGQAKGVQFELIAGERRWRAGRLAKMKDVPIIVRQADDLLVIELQTIENDKRKDLSAIQKAEKYQQLLDQYGKAGISGEKGMERLQAKIGKAKSTIYEALALTKLTPKVKKAVEEQKLPPSHAGLIAKLEKFPDFQEQIFKEAIEVDEWDEGEITPAGNKVLPYRDLKSIVEQQVTIGKNRQEWGHRVEEGYKKGIKFLATVEENEKALSSDKYVRGGQCNYDYSGKNSYKDLMGPHAPKPILAHDEEYIVIELYPKAEVMAAIKANGKKPTSPGLNRSAQSRGSSAAKAAQAAAARTRKETAERRAIVDAVVNAATQPTSKWSAKQHLAFALFLMRAMKQRLLSDTSREMFNRRKLNPKDWKKAGSYNSPHTNWLRAELIKVTTTEQARALIVDMAVAMDLCSWAGEHGQRLPNMLDVACQVFGVNKAKAIRAAEAKPKPAKVQASGKSKPAKKKGKKK